jgi:hypothetical protein
MPWAQTLIRPTKEITSRGPPCLASARHVRAADTVSPTGRFSPLVGALEAWAPRTGSAPPRHDRGVLTDSAAGEIGTPSVHLNSAVATSNRLIACSI